MAASSMMRQMDASATSAHAVLTTFAIEMTMRYAHPSSDVRRDVFKPWM